MRPRAPRLCRAAGQWKQQPEEEQLQERQHEDDEGRRSRHGGGAVHAVGGCSVYNSMLKGTETVMHKKLGLSMGDKVLDRFVDDYSPYLEGVEFDKINQIFGNRIQPTQM